jgi:hypothetical protein
VKSGLLSANDHQTLELVFQCVKSAYASRYFSEVCFVVYEGEAECINCREHIAPSAVWEDIHVYFLIGASPLCYINIEAFIPSKTQQI